MTLHDVLQLGADGLLNGSQYALLGVSFALILGVTGRFHYALALVFTVAAYVVAVLQASGGIPYLLLVLAAVGAAAVVGVACELLIYRPLARGARQTAALAHGSDSLSLLTVFVSSLGVTIAGVNLLSLAFGAQSRTLEPLGAGVNTVAGVTFTNLEFGSVVVAWALIGALTLLLGRTQAGRMIQAVRANPELAAIVGIGIDKVHLWVFALGSVLTGVGAITYGLRFAVTPDMGTRPVVFAFVVAFLGGPRSSPLVVGLAGVLLGLVESLSGLWLSSRWSLLVVFAALFAYLCAQPLPLRAILSLRPAPPVRSQ